MNVLTELINLLSLALLVLWLQDDHYEARTGPALEAPN